MSAKPPTATELLRRGDPPLKGEALDGINPHLLLATPEARCVSCMSHKNRLEREEESVNGNDPDRAISGRT
jgi:hypothetical protein